MEERELEKRRETVIERIITLNRNGPISTDYIRPIAEVCSEEVADDIIAAADPTDWNDDDVRLAFGRVLMRRLRIEV